MPRGLSDYDSARIQGRLWTPDALRPAAWWDTSDLSTMAFDAVGCTTLRDKSYQSIDLSVWDLGTGKPTLAIHGASGKNCLQFTNQRMRNQTKSVTSGTYTGNLNAFWAFADNGNDGIIFHERGSWGILPADLTGSGGGYVITDTTGVSRSQISLASYQKITAAAGSVNSLLHVPSSVPRLWINGSEQTGITVSEANITGSNTVNICSQSNGNFPAYGQLCEIFFTTTDFNNYDRWRAEGYLAWKWNYPLAADHPFANRPPLIGD